MLFAYRVDLSGPTYHWYSTNVAQDQGPDTLLLQVIQSDNQWAVSSKTGEVLSSHESLAIAMAAAETRLLLLPRIPTPIWPL